ncbi:MAG: hypothetical protein KGK08_10310 [Acidobacteriota bacterium]|nr:hypothetical protein [Acidobacteriota bacterium]
MLDIAISLLAKILVPLFFVGLIGSSIVVAVSFVEDLVELFGEDEQ